MDGMKFHRIEREDGRIELQCEHGVGHPSLVLMEREGREVLDWHGIHGCDGCCQTPEFQLEEAK